MSYSIRCYLGWHKWKYKTEIHEVTPKKFSPLKLTVRECKICKKRQRPTSIMRGDWVDIK